jgi:peptidoglycan/LPS O-acetylase OafA/YrhL
MTAMTHYRPDIDGLRAVAILPVIAFHMNPSLLRGGYTGVDVFFVISGYLITSIIWSGLAAGTFSFRRFYHRRIRRLMPALYLVMLASVPFAWATMIGFQFKDFGQSLAATSLWLSNFLFWIESGYFEPDATAKPLLHTWSLAVEEQFYVIFPGTLIALYGVYRKSFRVASAIALLVALASLGIAAVAEGPAAFYLIHARAWELMAGAICAVVTHERKPSPNNLASFIGLLLVVFSMLSADESLIPLAYAAPAVIGTSLVLLFGGRTTWAGRILSLRMLVAIGLGSYSLYLWHQPVLAFLKIAGIELDTALRMVTAATAIGLISWISYRFVEFPLRSRKVLFGRYDVDSLVYLAPGVALLAAGAWLHLDQPKTWRERNFSADERRISSFRTWRDESHHICPVGPPLSCTPGGGKPVTVVWGDSHAGSLGLAFNQSTVAPVLSFSLCPPFVDAPRTKECSEYLVFSEEVVRKSPPGSLLLLHSAWAQYPELGRIEKRVEWLRQARPDMQLALIGPGPYFQGTMPEVLIANKVPVTRDARVAMPTPAKVYAADKELERIATRLHLPYVSLLSALCGESNSCVAFGVAPDGLQPLIFDSGHLTLGGSLLVKEIILRSLEVKSP